MSAAAASSIGAFQAQTPISTARPAGGQPAGFAGFLAMLEAALQADPARPPLLESAPRDEAPPPGASGNPFGDAPLPDFAKTFLDKLSEASPDHDPVAEWQTKLPPHLAAILTQLKEAADEATTVAAASSPEAQWLDKLAALPAGTAEEASHLRQVLLRVPTSEQSLFRGPAPEQYISSMPAAQQPGARAGAGAEASAAGQADLVQQLRQQVSGRAERADLAETQAAAPERASEATARNVAFPDAAPAGRPPAPAGQPEQVASVLATLQSLGEDAAGIPRFALPANAPLPHAADPAGHSNLALRAAVPAVAAEILSHARSGARQFEIRLDPPELGRIEVTLDFRRDGSMAAKLIVERPETLDMLMRDARSLEKTLQQGGLKLEDGAVHYQLRDQSTFERQDRAAHHGPASGQDAPQRDDDADDPAPADSRRRSLALGAIDIRV